jgi:hypothetical protein
MSPQVADGYVKGSCEYSEQADVEWSSSLGLGQGLTTPNRKKKKKMKKIL